MRKVLKKYLIIIASFYIFWLGILPCIVSKTVIVVCKNLSQNSSYEISFNNFTARFSVIPTATFKLKDLKIRIKQTDSELILKDLNCNIRLLPIISGKFHINNILASDLDLVLNLDKKIELDKDFFRKLEKTKVHCDHASINNFSIKFYPKDIKTPMLYSGKIFDYKKNNRALSINLDSEFIIDKDSTDISTNLYIPRNNDIKKTIFDVSITNFDIGPLKTYLKHYLPEDLINLEGIINIKASKNEIITELKNCQILRKDLAKSIIFPQNFDIKSKFNIKRQYINFEQVNIESKNINLVMNGRISDYFGQSMPSVDFNILINKSRVEDIVNLLPAFKIEELNVYKLKQYKLFGDAIGNITIKGRLPEPEVLGDIFINNVVLVKPIPNATRGGVVKLKLTGRHVFFDVDVPAGYSEKVWVKGNQELYNIKYAELTVKSTNNVSLKSAQDVVNPLHEILNFIIGPVPIMDLAGVGNIDILVKGNRKNPHVWGVFNVRNGIISFLEMADLKLKEADAVLNFNDENVSFLLTKGLVNNRPFNIDGTCNLNGKFEFKVNSKDQPTSSLYNAIKNSSLTPELVNMLPKFENISGMTDLDLVIYGAVKYIEELKFNQNFFAKGQIALKNNSLIFEKNILKNINGNIDFDTINANANIQANLADSLLSLNAKIKNGIGDIAFSVPKINPNLVLQDANLRLKQYLPYVSIDGKYKGDISNFEYDKLSFVAKILEQSPSNEICIKSGELFLANDKLVLKDIKGYIKELKNTIDLDLKVENIFTKDIKSQGVFKLNIPDISIMNEIITSELLPQNIRNITKKLQLINGTLSTNGRIINNRIYTDVDLAGISFLYAPQEMPVNIINGNISIKNNLMKLNKINLLADNMPILIDGEIRDIFDKQIFNIYLNSKPQQEFIDKYFNKTQIYPIKIKGDIVYWVRLKGIKENFELKSNINMSKNSSFYHYGATIGDIENAIVVDIDSRILEGNVLRLKEFSYDKLIDSQSGKQTHLNLLKAWGGVEIFKDDLLFKNLRIKTTNPTDARVFNIIFRKPNIKQGQFTSDLRLNGKLSNPNIVGDFHIFETNIPFFDTIMKNIELVFKERTVEITSKGEVMGNDLSFNGVLQNKLTEPYVLEKGILYTKDLDLNRITNKLKISQVDDVSTFEYFDDFKLSSIIFNNLIFKADNISLRNIRATNYEALTSLNQRGIFEIHNFIFNIAQGELNGRYKYNLKNNDMHLVLDAKKINANDIAVALFDLENQVYGDMTGKFNLSCNGTNFESCMQTLNGDSLFNVSNGRMPKLGSLEYLLKASNLVKGGITGLSINSVIDLITPLKTGEFSDIFGSVRIKDGIARNIEITSKGKDLSLYIGGTYNFATSIADMQVLGLLSRKISTVLGPIGNMSINTLFNVIPGVDLAKDSSVLDKINKIPGIELSSKAYRKFIAEIKGDIDGDEYVTSFKWIN